MTDPPGAVRAPGSDGLIPSIEGFSPMEASTLVHEEASFIANGQRATELLNSYGLGKMTYEELLPALRSLPRYVPPPAATTPAEMYERADAQYGQDPWCALRSLQPVPGFPLPHTLTEEQHEECARAIRADASVTSAA